MNILIAPDSFKESLTAVEVCQAIKAGLSQVFPEANYTLLPLADGGEGTSEVLSFVLDGYWRQLTVHDPLMRLITAKYLITKDGTAVIEIAEACGLHLLTEEERNPLITTSFGVGEMITDAIKQGVKSILIGLGGSATNDAGAGMLQALGVKLTDSANNELSPGGSQLNHLKNIQFGALEDLLSEIQISVACDVTSPLCGPTGASHVFGPQKGASIKEVSLLNQALNHFDLVTSAHNVNVKHNNTNFREMEGAGAAGGLGYALMAYCKAELKSGFEIIASLVNLDDHLANVDLVITGEGRFDAQTAMGKVASGVANQAKLHNNLPVIAICGAVDRQHIETVKQRHDPSPIYNLYNNTPAFDIVVPSIQKLDNIENILKNAYNNVAITAYQVATGIKLGQNLNL
ncbi:glycerate kinase [Psychrobacter sp.]|uniref:glycerate kinase n=1 Tax=Psychrobacter sp. TaxID=56811 RepID=UPI0025CC13EB|nr:glycerate kinase [Psychrobacter sp.]